MRDLAADFSPRSHTPSRILRLILVVVVIFGVFFLIKNRLGGNTTVSSSNPSLHNAPAGLKPVTVNGSNSVVGGVDLTTQSAKMRDVSGGSATATVTRSFGGGTYILNVEATLPDPKNTYYEVWLVGGGQTVPIDFMTGAKTSWSLHLRDSDKYSKYNGIWITLERTKDNLPEEHVMEGSF